jgi:hypothetical protein
MKTPNDIRETKLRTTNDIRNKLLELWEGYEKGEIDATTARTHIGFARATLDTLKVEIAAAHLSTSVIPPVTLQGVLKKQIKATEAQAA